MRWRLLLVFVSCAAGAPLLSAPAPLATEPRLELRLKAIDPKVKNTDKSRWEVSIVNRGKQKVTLVQPGDGSDCGWRTPIIEWVVDGKVPNEISSGQVDVKVVRKGKDEKPEPKPELKPLCLSGRLAMGGRCGNVNPLRENEVFELATDKEVKLNEWVGRPHLSAGKHKVALRYFNLPDHACKGLTLGRNDAKAMQRVKASQKVTLESNSVEIVVEE
jgi:hypothetical protein